MNIRIGTLLRTVFLTLAVYPGGYAHAQSIPENPPDQVIAAAVAAFPEYKDGAPLDAFIGAAKDSTEPALPGSSADTPITVPLTLNTHPHGSYVGGPAYPDEFIMRMVASSNIICLGVPLKSWTYPTIEKTFGVTIYLVKPTNLVLPDRLGDPALGYIYIVKAGGRFTYNDKYFSAVDKDFPALTLQAPYLFFATRVGPSVYKVNAPQTLKVSGSSVLETSVEHQYAEFYRRRSLDALLREAAEAWNEIDAARKWPR